MAKDKEEILEEFTEIPGVGMSKARALMKGGFKDMKALKKATVDELTETKGINERLANDIYEFLHGDEDEPEDAGDEAPEAEETEEEAVEIDIPVEEAEPKPASKSARKESEADTLVKNGIDLHKMGKWGQALQSFNEALRLDPVHQDAMMARGDIYLEREKYERALESYEVLIEINPENVKAWIRYGDTLMTVDKLSEATACYKKALEIDPDNESAKERLSEHERIKTYIEGLDENLEGGIPARHIVLVCGRAGSMKSSVSYSIIHNQSKHEGTKCIYLTLEQSRASLMRHMKKLGFDNAGVSDLMVSDLDDMVIIDMALLRKETAVEDIGEIDWLGSIISQIRNYRDTFGCEIVVIDSMSALYSLTSFKNPRSELFIFFEKLRDLGITVLLISEMYEPDGEVFGRYGVEEFLADAIIHLKTEKYGKGTNLFLGVVKMRETDHDRDYFPLILDKQGFAIVHD